MRAAFAFIVVALLSGCAGFGIGGPSPEDFISDPRYTSMLIEVFHPSDSPPRDTAVQLLEQRAKERMSKPDGITVERHAYEGDSQRWSVGDLRNLADDVPATKTGNRRVVLTVLYVNGGSDQDTNNERVLGVFFQPGGIALFPDNINAGGLLGSPFGASEVERAVLVHEFGHAIGLVNIGLKMKRDHEDEGHKGHSSNPESVMTWQVETSLGLASLTGSIPTQFDSDDIADIRAAGGK